jgi:DNA-binding GntR family transcriptional regulator
MPDLQRPDVPPFNPNPAAYVYAEMADHLQLRIRLGDLPKDARLPGERELAEVYGVALGTARRAVEELRDRGLVITLPGKGTYVQQPPAEQAEGE